MRNACLHLLRERQRRDPAVSVYEDADVVAFLDLGTLRPGHTQKTARLHVTIFESTDGDEAHAHAPWSRSMKKPTSRPRAIRARRTTIRGAPVISESIQPRCTLIATSQAPRQPIPSRTIPPNGAGRY
jgi:hypothetical protein